MSTPAYRRLALGVAVAFVLLFLFLKGVDARTLAGTLRSADPLLLAGTVFMTVVTYLLRSWRWGSLLAPIVRVPFPRLVSATFVAFFVGLAVPRASEVVRPYLVARRHPVTTSGAFASIVVERLIDVVTVVFLLAVYLYVLPRPTQESPGSLLRVLEWGGVVAALGALGVLTSLAVLHTRSEWALGLLDRLASRLPARVAGPVQRAVAAFTGGLAVLKASPRHLMLIAAQSVLLWLSIGLGIHFNNRALGLDLPFHSTFLILAFLTVGVAIPTPGMVGGFHEAYLLALTQVFGVAKGTAAAAGIACHALNNLPVLVFGLAFLAYEGLSVGRLARLAEKSDTEPAGDPSALAPGVPAARRP
jgi:glycosyltransferase 2 family protein